MTEGGGFKEYVRYCTTALCNDWDGISASTGGGSGGGGGGGGGGNGGSGSGGGANSGDGSGSIWLVAGVGNSGTRNQLVDLYVAIITFSVVMKLYW